MRKSPCFSFAISLFRAFAIPSLSTLILASGAAISPPLWAAGDVRLDLVGDAQGSTLAFQQWAQDLGKAGVRNVRIRSGDATAGVGIEVQGTADRPLYVVTGVIRSGNELVLPGGRFSRGDAKKAAAWLEDLAANGPPETRPKKAAFGLTLPQFEQVHDDLARPVGFATKDMPRREAVAKIVRQLRLPLRQDAATTETIGDEKVSEDLAELSCGTALACLLRPAGYCLAPRASGQKLEHTVVRSRPGLEVWPVGWDLPQGKRPSDVAPGMFELLNVNIQNVPASQALEAIGQRAKLPVLMDHNALARHGIDPAQAIVSLPAGKTTYSIALRKLLFKAGLKFEIRLDEASHPLLWVSTVKPM